MSMRIMTVNEPGFAVSVHCGVGMPLPTAHMIGHALTGPMTTVLVVGGGAGLAEDLAAIKELGVEPGVVIATPAGLAAAPDRVNHVAMLGPQPGDLPDSVSRSKDSTVTAHLLGGLPADLALSGADYRWAFNPAPVPGCEISFAVHLGLALQADRVVLAGVDGEGWDDERLTAWRVLSEGLYSGRVVLARNEGPLAAFLPTPVQMAPSYGVIKHASSGLMGASSTKHKR